METNITQQILTDVNGDVSIDVSTLENPVRIGSVWLRDNAGTLETSTNGVTWMGIGGVDLSQYAKTSDLTPYALKTDLTPYALKTDLTPYALNADLQAHINDATVHGGGGTPTAYALAWTDGSAILLREFPGSWFFGDVQIWTRVYLGAAGQFLNMLEIGLSYAAEGNLTFDYGIYTNDEWFERHEADARTVAAGWHDIALQWTNATRNCILYIDGVGGTPIIPSPKKTNFNAASIYEIHISSPSLKLASLIMSDQLTWDATTAAKETIGTPRLSLPLTEGSGATATDSTGTAWTIPAGVAWEAL